MRITVDIEAVGIFADERVKLSDAVFKTVLETVPLKAGRLDGEFIVSINGTGMMKSNGEPMNLEPLVKKYIQTAYKD